MSKILIWETLAKIGGGQEMTLKVVDVLKPHHDLHFLIPEEGELSLELKQRNIPYTLMGDQTMPKGEKGFKGLLRFAYLTIKASFNGRKAVKKLKPDILYALRYSPPFKSSTAPVIQRASSLARYTAA